AGNDRTVFCTPKIRLREINVYVVSRSLFWWGFLYSPRGLLSAIGRIFLAPQHDPGEIGRAQQIAAAQGFAGEVESPQPHVVQVGEEGFDIEAGRLDLPRGPFHDDRQLRVVLNDLLHAAEHERLGAFDIDLDEVHTAVEPRQQFIERKATDSERLD